MTKRILFCANHDNFWTTVSAELERRFNFEVKVWVGKERKVSQEGKKYFSIGRHEAFHLKNLTLLGSYERLRLEQVPLEDYINFLKIFDRADVDSKLSYSERNHLFFCHISYWLKVLTDNKIELILFSNIPHTPEGYGLHVAAKIIGVRFIIFNITPFPGLIYITNRIRGDMAPVNEAYSSDFQEVKKIVHDYIESVTDDKSYEPWYMKKQYAKASETFIKSIRNIKGGGLSLAIILISLLAGRKAKIFSGGKYLSVKRHDGVYDGAQKSICKEFTVRIRWNFYRKRLENELTSNEGSALPKRYFYLPLHYQPEATTAPGAGFFADQQVMVDVISRSLPEGVCLVVKEHPSQLLPQNWGISGRYLGYWDRICRHDNVVLIKRTKDTRQLIKGSLGVITAAGTAGFEAALLGKPCFVFGHPWYVKHPDIVKLDFQNASQQIAKTVTHNGNLNNHSRSGPLTESQEDFYNMLFRSLISCDIHNQAGGAKNDDASSLAETIARYV